MYIVCLLLAKVFIVCLFLDTRRKNNSYYIYIISVCDLHSIGSRRPSGGGFLGRGGVHDCDA